MTDEYISENLSPAERRAFEQLPREAKLPEHLEDRVVAALRKRGTLPTPLSLEPAGRGRNPALKFWIPIAAAATIAVFVTGFAAGQLVGTRTVMPLAQRVVETDAVRAAAQLQQAGSEYVTALASLSSRVDSAPPAVRDSVRSVAMRVLGRAAEEMALIAPDDPLAAAVLRGINQRQSNTGPAVPSRSVVWY
jgi:hypothetical protein